MFAGDGRAYAKGTFLRGNDGKPIVPGSATAVAVTDWDGDGDLDLVVGVISGNVLFLPNEGTKSEPRFGKERPVLAAGKPIVANDGGPCVADWDGDGTEDLILGDGEGSVRWFRAKRNGLGVPVLAAAKILVKAQGFLPTSVVNRPMARTKPAVADWNGDGKLDLLVGDFWTRTRVEPVPAAKRAEVARMQKQFAAAQNLFVQRASLADAAARKAVGLLPGATLSAHRRAAYAKEYNRVLAADPQFKKANATMSAIRGKLPRASSSLGGYVWVYLRR
jgi:hypothetical protein